jgi:hypothetical protein
MGKFTLGYFPEFLYKILLISCFLFADSILCVEMLKVIVRGKFSPGLNCLENISVGRRGFLLSWSQISLRYLEKRTDIK